MENQQPVNSTTVRPGSLKDHLAKLTTIMNTSPAHGDQLEKGIRKTHLHVFHHGKGSYNEAQSI